MHKTFVFLALVWLVFSSKPLQSAEFPRNLTQLNIDRIVELLSVPATARLLRSAEPYAAFPGLKIGMDFITYSTKGVNELGDGGGSLPGLVVMPRIHVAKGLFYNLDVIFELMPTPILSSASVLGVILKWTVINEKDDFASLALFTGYTELQGWDVFSGYDVEIGFVMSRDYTITKPYLGLGFLFGKGELHRSVVALGEENSGGYSTLHFFIGVEWETTFNISTQLDFLNLSPALTVAISKKF